MAEITPNKITDYFPPSPKSKEEKDGKQDQVENGMYRKVPKFSDAQKLCCNLPEIQAKRPNLHDLRDFPQKRCKWNSKQ